MNSILSKITTPPRSRNSSTTRLTDLDSITDKLAISHAAERDEQSQRDYVDEKQPLLSNGQTYEEGVEKRGGNVGGGVGWRIAHAVLYGVRMVFSTLTAPGRYVLASFYDENGIFSAVMPMRSFAAAVRGRKRSRRGEMGYGSDNPASHRQEQPRRRRSPSLESNASYTSNSEREDSPARHTRSRTAAAATTTADPPDGQSPASTDRAPRIRIKDNSLLRKRKSPRSGSTASTATISEIASSLKSPPSTSSAALTRYPRSPQTPRPLVPRRQPSYTSAPLALSRPDGLPKKTLIIDLDETLIHSMAKGGRMSTGHMVEVKLNYPASAGGGPQLASGVPILYYVHERPACHEFLRKVAKWYTLIVFTASVQEYADPVIDWLERERKYFSGRYYRQHCTYRNGAYIKDLAMVEPDLSRVAILDNSPMSYIFHEDNAIPIEGWISDPTDNDLLHLIPLLEGMQYVTDVRALLALRQGQAMQA
ncbi:related to nuclear envelope protein NEM1 [Ramularia collo-cygni]|uniref:Related to nuclear envelope protein NEM1 n=1 Tax=Ramularia collo-cygni TaxID=112498 RepID=A0A2D3VBB5_9PEZI|nr:related to nuclear envelope protein NEM1 [Ramularia collo-cygni]CZT20976.1 related to nuclear envelope protein NEM1 [Ramularia collo-cygni]